MNYNIFLLLTLALILIFILYKYIKFKKIKKVKIDLLKSWGKSTISEYTQNDFNYISYYYRNNIKENDITVDDITWNDLDMNSIFKKLNNTLSFIGETVLYKILRTPEFKNNVLYKRKKIMDLLSKNKELRLQLQLSIMNLGKNRKLNIYNYISSESSNSFLKSLGYRLLSLFAIMSIVVVFFNKSLGSTLVILSFIVNIFMYYKSILSRSGDIKTINNIVNLVNCARTISKINSEALIDYTSSLSKLYDKTKNISTNGMFLTFGNQNEIIQYAKIYFLIDIINYNKVSKSVSMFKKELLEIYFLIGELDSLISTSSFRDSLSFYSIPELKKSDTKSICIEDLYHPLISNPISNSIFTEKSILITGSNASGKSTFLKSIAISSIFAQTMCFSFSNKHKSNFFRIVSSMSLSDNIIDNESYYMAEIKSLKRIVDVIKSEIPTICFIDEVLRGTNTIERISASTKILEYIGNKNCLCFTATHDIELTELLFESFINYHFKEDFKENNIYFDYKLYLGKSNSRNAIKLLKIIGFDESIIKNANNLAKFYTSTGTWNKNQRS